MYDCINNKSFTYDMIQKNRMVVIGGGNGHNLLQSGYDLADVWVLDAHARQWVEVPTRGKELLPSLTPLGREHDAQLVGQKIGNWK